MGRRENTEGLLTDKEHETIDALGQAATLYREVLTATGGVTAAADFAEFAAHIHDCQNAVLANAAARAYPKRYRLSGGTIR